MTKPLRIMKFGGSSVGDAACITRVTEIVQSTSSSSSLVIVVSAMRGITNRLLEAAAKCEAGDSSAVRSILEEVYFKHDFVASSLVASPVGKQYLTKRIRELVREAQRKCETAAGAGRVTPADRDAIAALGERLCVEIISETLSHCGLCSRPIDGSEIVITNGNHGAAQAMMDRTRHECERVLRPLLKDGVIPVVTGFVGATREGEVTTLGRGGSDYSAGILGAALQADEVIVWKDVDGMLTADPRKIKAPRTIPQMSYREAAELAGFGAQVLHPKALEVLEPSGIPLAVRNSFSPKHPGSRITVQGGRNDQCPKAIIATSDVALIAVSKPSALTQIAMQNQVARVLDILPGAALRSCASLSRNGMVLLVSSPIAQLAAEVLRSAFGGHSQGMKLHQNVATVNVIGEKVSASSETAERGIRALEGASLHMIAVLQGRFECSVCFVVPRDEIDCAEAALYREFQLDLTSASKNDEVFQSATNGNTRTTALEVPDWVMGPSRNNTLPV